MKKIHLVTITLVVIILFSSCQSSVSEDIVKSNNEEMTSVSYNGVEYIEHEYTFEDEFRPFLCSYSLTEYDNSLMDKDVYSIDESFVADKRDENLNFIYIPLLIWENSIYQRKNLVVPKLEEIHNEVDSLLIVYPGISSDQKSKKQTINDPEQISLILNFFESIENSEPIETGSLPADNKQIYMCAVSGCYGGEFDVGPEFIYFSNSELIAFVDGKQYKAPAEVNDILQDTERTEYKKDLTFIG